MPMEFLDRVTLPSLRVYAIFSVIVFLCSVFYAAQVVRDTSWRANHTYTEIDNGPGGQPIVREPMDNISGFIGDIRMYMGDEPICFWALTNMMHCGFICFGKLIQELVFGELRPSERQHLKDKFWNFVFYKSVFMFGVLNVQYMHEMAIWWAWFTALGFLSLLSQLCKDRLEYLSFSPTTPGWRHARLFALLVVILALSLFMLLACTAAAFFLISFHTFAFAAAECTLLAIRALHLLLRHSLPLSYSLSSPSSVTFSYYTDLGAELLALSVDLFHHLHMLSWSNVFLSMASLVIFMQMRYLFYEIQRRVSRHRNWLAVMAHMEQSYPMATQEDLTAHSDSCAICWERMEAARKLPCGHLFHNACLQSWLEQDTSCPTCRMTLTMQSRALEPAQAEAQARRNENHFFHFDGSRYVSWLPSFSVEVSNVRLRNGSAIVQSNSQMDAMVRQVQQLFPHYPRNVILEDLRQTRSVEWTVENILDGALALPHHLLDEPRSDHAPTAHATPSTVREASPTPRQERFDLPVADTSVEEPSNLGGRFSKSSVERERILQRRKEHMRLQARRRYLDKHRHELAVQPVEN